MRELKLPKAVQIRFHYDEKGPKSRAAGNDLTDEMAIIEKNGTEILTATIMIEDRMIEAVSKILFGGSKTNKKSRDFFINEVMDTSYFSYAFKRRVFTRLIEQMGILDPDRMKSFKAGLSKIMKWRNAFAHGKIIHELNAGYLLQYYSDGKQEIVLDDDFFEKVESTIRDCLYTCNGIIQSE